MVKKDKKFEEFMKDLTLKNVYDFNHVEDPSRKNLEKPLVGKECSEFVHREVSSRLKELFIKKWGEVDFASEMIISGITMKMGLILRAKQQLAEEELIISQKSTKKVQTIKRYSGGFDNLYNPFTRKKELNPLINTLIKLEKGIHDSLESLGLLPKQSLEREKLTVIGKIKGEGIEGVERELMVKAEKERKSTPKNKKRKKEVILRNVKGGKNG